MDKQWYRTPSFIILMVFGGVLIIAMVIDKNDSPGPSFDNISTQPLPLPVSSEKKNSSVMDIPLDALTERLAKKLEAKPNDIPGWTLLGRSYANLGQHEKSVQAFEKAMALAPNDVNLRVTYGETLVASAEGKVTPEAHKVFMSAHKIDPEHPGARYNLALEDHQTGNSQKAYDTLTELKEKAPANAPWIKKVDDLLAKVAVELNLPVPPSSTPAQSIEPDKSSETQSPNGNQEAFIRSMVDRLAARMEKNPSDLEGWMKLGRSYKVLGEYNKAALAYEKAMALAPNDPKIRELYQEMRKS